MNFTKKQAAKFTSLTIAGAGALTIGASDAEAAAIVITPSMPLKVGFGAGFTASANATATANGPKFKFWRTASSFNSFRNEHGNQAIFASGLSGLGFAMSGGYLRIVAPGGLPGGSFGSRGLAGRRFWFTTVHSSASTYQAYPSSYNNQYALFRFISSLDGQFHHGWAELSLANLGAFGTAAFPNLTVHRWAWEDAANTPLAAGDTVGLVTATPEPSAFWLTGLGALGLGAQGIRRWRAAKQQTQIAA